MTTPDDDRAIEDKPRLHEVVWVERKGGRWDQTGHVYWCITCGWESRYVPYLATGKAPAEAAAQKAAHIADAAVAVDLGETP